MFEVYTKKVLCDGLYSIAERYEENGHAVMMYLVVGESKAALIDSGFGVTGTLRKFVEEITDKPIMCIAAHGHPDHAGSAAQFDEIYMNERDEELLPISLSYDRRMGDVFRHCKDEELREFCDKNIVMPDKLNYKNIEHGDVVDLGGTKLEVFSIPGHTQGSLALYNQEQNYALVSDAFSKRTALVTLPPERRVGITAYRDGIANFLEATNEDTKFFWGHSEDELPRDIAKDMMMACTEVLEGKTENDVESISLFAKRKSASGKKMREHKFGVITLVYDANTL